MPSFGLKYALVAVAVALVLGGAVLGVAGAQQASELLAAATPGATPQKSGDWQQRHEQFLATVAGKLGVSTDKLKQAFADARKELGLPDHPGGPFGPRGGPGGPFFGKILDSAAQAIGISGDQLRKELPGKTLTDVAKAHNVDPKKVADALKADAIKRVDQGVADQRLTSEQAAHIKQGLDDHINFLMTRQFPSGGFLPGPGGPGGERHVGPRGPGGSPR